MMPLGLIFSLWMAPQVDTCISVRGNEILARDLSAAGFLFSLLDPNTVFGLTPRPGSRRVLSSRELAAVVSRSGIAIGADAEFTSGICVERAAGILSAGEIRTALASAVGDDHAQIEVLDYTREPLPPGQLQFKTSGVSRTGTPFVVIWYGRLTYDPGRSLAIWARVKVFVQRTAVIAVARLETGRPIETKQIKVELLIQSPWDTPFADSMERVLGKIPIRSLSAEKPVPLSALREPNDINPGDRVQVRVAVGAAHIGFEAVAVSGGRAGDSIAVRNEVNGRLLHGRIEDKGTVIVRTGGSA